MDLALDLDLVLLPFFLEFVLTPALDEVDSSNLPMMSLIANAFVMTDGRLLFFSIIQEQHFRFFLILGCRNCDRGATSMSPGVLLKARVMTNTIIVGSSTSLVLKIVTMRR